MKPKILTLLVCGSLAVSAAASAQNISFNPFSSAPLMLNPAFTGMYDGKVRANVLYRNQWGSVTVPWVSMAASVDMPVYSGKNNYLAAGGQVFRGVAGDGALANSYGLASAAFHQKLRHGMSIGIGAQLSYTQKSIDLSYLYFSPPAGSFTTFPAPGTPIVWAPHDVRTYALNAGASLSQDVSPRFNYTVGLAFNNINQPNDAIERKMSRIVGNDMHGNVVLSARWQATKRLEMRPSFLYQVGMDRQNLIGGSEFHLGLDAGNAMTASKNTVFTGLWYRSGDAVSITAGVEIKGFRTSLGYDYHMSTLSRSSEGNGGFEVAVRYIPPKKK